MQALPIGIRSCKDSRVMGVLVRRYWAVQSLLIPVFGLKAMCSIMCMTSRCAPYYPASHPAPFQDFGVSVHEPVMQAMFCYMRHGAQKAVQMSDMGKPALQ